LWLTVGLYHLPPFAKTFRAARGEYFATGLPWLFDLLKSSAFTGRAINFFWFGSFHAA
jgi:hypothetical protein